MTSILLKKKTQGIKHWLARKSCQLAQKLPRTLRTPCLNILASLAWRLDKRSQRMSKRGLTLAYPDKDKYWKKNLAKTSYYNALHSGADLLWLKDTASTLHNEEVVKEALSAGKGVCLLTLHLGSWETLVMGLCKKGYPAKMLTNVPKSFDILHQCYQQANIPYVCRGTPASLMQLMQAIRSGELVCFFSDQFGDEVSVTLFDQETQAPAGGINLAMMLGAKVIIGWSWKDEHNQHHASFEPFEIEQKNSRQDTLQHNMQRVIDRFETLIKEHPEQWLWCYNRFKRLKKNQPGEK